MEYLTDYDYVLIIIGPIYYEQGNLPRLVNELSDYLLQTSYISE